MSTSAVKALRSPAVDGFLKTSFNKGFFSFLKLWNPHFGKYLLQSHGTGLVQNVLKKRLYQKKRFHHTQFSKTYLGPTHVTDLPGAPSHHDFDPAYVQKDTLEA